ncbi:hypothetical protein CVU76_02185 [Candidatus Dojkabacteria bacterium HGW-Dojkabacteria-1]|uniref:Uncharacterized protein n=1 Tax=Candidatus Dojkabacteria bacterium HGW-Dojkabacteria-1 TaxID=2013761 RepID=A0A2N2F3N4_9BACT|nr:MAG: hypothetical protein CVU76_02185 [Candidatus Dojkabacteria bacterium HGW-Dojkabacteria-1]
MTQVVVVILVLALAALCCVGMPILSCWTFEPDRVPHDSCPEKAKEQYKQKLKEYYRFEGVPTGP